MLIFLPLYSLFMLFVHSCFQTLRILTYELDFLLLQCYILFALWFIKFYLSSILLKLINHLIFCILCIYFYIYFMICGYWFKSFIFSLLIVFVFILKSNVFCCFGVFHFRTLSSSEFLENAFRLFEVNLFAFQKIDTTFNFVFNIYFIICIKFINLVFSSSSWIIILAWNGSQVGFVNCTLVWLLSATVLVSIWQLFDEYPCFINRLVNMSVFNKVPYVWGNFVVQNIVFGYVFLLKWLASWWKFIPF